MKLCKCGNARRPRQKNCLECHKIYMREYRVKHRHKIADYRGYRVYQKPGKRLNRAGNPMIAGEIYFDDGRLWVPQQEDAEQMLIVAKRMIDKHVDPDVITQWFSRALV